MYLFDSLSNRSLFFINYSAMIIGYSISFETCLFKIKNSVNFYLCIIFVKNIYSQLLLNDSFHSRDNLFSK